MKSRCPERWLMPRLVPALREHVYGRCCGTDHVREHRCAPVTAPVPVRHVCNIVPIDCTQDTTLLPLFTGRQRGTRSGTAARSSRSDAARAPNPCDSGGFGRRWQGGRKRPTDSIRSLGLHTRRSKLRARACALWRALTGTSGALRRLVIDGTSVCSRAYFQDSVYARFLRHVCSRAYAVCSREYGHVCGSRTSQLLSILVSSPTRRLGPASTSAVRRRR